MHQHPVVLHVVEHLNLIPRDEKSEGSVLLLVVLCAPFPADNVSDPANFGTAHSRHAL
jgi:hypothetical protein